MGTTVSGGIFATLIVQHGPLAGRQFPMTQSVVTIGRTAGSDLIIDDPEVSRRHARLTWTGQQFLIEDLGSTNGTFVNNVRVVGPQSLSPGDSLRLGTLTLSFHSPLQMVPIEAITHVSMPAPRVVQPPPPPPPSYVPVYAAPVPPRGSRATPWLLALGLGAVLVLALIGLGLAFVLFRGLGSEATTVEITSPATGAQVTVGEAMPVLAVASDPRGIARVELWVNGRLADSMVNPSASGRADFPVQFQWTADEQGSHLLEIRAYNRDGRSSELASVSVRAAPGVAPTPTIAIALVEPTPTIVIALVEPTPTGMAALTQTSPMPTVGPAPGTCASGSAFVADMTIPDYTQVQPGQRVDKIWRVRNSGTCPWGPGYVLAYAGGDQMSAPPAQAVGSTPPGGTADVQVTMYAPGAPGTYTGYWQMRDAAGQSFGSRLSVVIVVPLAGGPPADTPTTPPEPGPPADTPTTPPEPGPGGCSPTIDFRADRTVINAGESTTMRWDVECVREVYFQGQPVTGHESREVSPAGTTTYTLRVVRTDGGSEERQVTVSVTGGGIGVVEEEPDISIAFHSYDAGSGRAIFRIRNGPASLPLESMHAQIINFSTGKSYYDGYSNTPFASSASPVPFDSRLGPDREAYLKYVLRTSGGRLPPTDVRCRARITVYTGDGRTGGAVTKTVDFITGTDHVVEPEQPVIGATIAYHSYDRTTRWVTLRIQNTGGVTIESAKATFNAPSGPGVLYGPASSNSPFRDSPTSNALVDSVAPGATKYMRYRLREAPPGTAVAATIELYSGEDLGGQSLPRTTGFILP